MSFAKSRAYSVLYMFAIGAVFAGVLSPIKVATAEKIADNAKLDASKNLVRVFELAEITPDSTGAELAELIKKYVRALWVVDRNGRPEVVEEEPASPFLLKCWAKTDDKGVLQGFAFPVGGKGFWGPIEGIMSVKPDGITIETVVWTKHSETPGLGARIEEKQYRDKFRGKLASPPGAARLEVVPDGTMGDDPHKIDQITGATQTTVVGMETFLNENFEVWNEYLPMLREHFGL